MANEPEKKVEKKDCLIKLGVSASDNCRCVDIYTVPEVLDYLKFKYHCSVLEPQYLWEAERGVRHLFGEKQHQNLAKIIQNLERNELINNSNCLRVKMEILFGGIGGDQEFLMDNNSDKGK